MLIRFEEFIGNDIALMPGFRCIFSEDDHSYYLKSQPDLKLYNTAYGTLKAITDTNKSIESVLISFSEILDSSIYNEMIKTYGYPNSILGIDELLSESRSDSEEGDEFKQTLTKRDYSMKDVDYNDQPSLVFWNKGSYEIKIMFNYVQNWTQLVFTKSKRSS